MIQELAARASVALQGRALLLISLEQETDHFKTQATTHVFCWFVLCVSFVVLFLISVLANIYASIMLLSITYK